MGFLFAAAIVRILMITKANNIIATPLKTKSHQLNVVL